MFSYNNKLYVLNKVVTLLFGYKHVLFYLDNLPSSDNTGSVAFFENLLIRFPWSSSSATSPISTYG